MHVACVSVVTGPACSKNVQEQKCLVNYQRTIAEIPADFFVAPELRQSMLTKLKCGLRD